ncbi:MAG: prolipoprotein diacylglyceryl transferase [Chlamydiae bacterium]|nr:prolipoprotein diacylglyceryl transferase [Chlamydiota bacterium]
MIGFLYWDPSRYMFNFTLPLLNRPILWYGFLFALGFFLGYLILRRLLATYLLLFPEFTKEDILDPKRISQTILENKQAHFLKGKFIHKVEGDLPSVWSGFFNELMNTDKIPLLSPSRRNSLTKYLEELSSHTRNLLVKRIYLERLFGSAVCTIFHKARLLAEKISFACILGAVIGARIGDVLFYQSFEHLMRDPLLIFKVWEGGLASHGGAIGMIIALYITSKRKEFKVVKLTLLRILDLVVIPTALAGSVIRMGNFMNQEILGTLSSLPWAVVFGHPADGSSPAPRHPVQLYESICYFLLFLGLGLFWRRFFLLKRPGRLFGLFLVLLFTIRFLLEFLKTEQSEYLTSMSYLTMGQYLSIPFILLGVFFFFRKSK